MDASSVPEVTASPKLYGLVGVCVHEGTWFALESRIAGLKRRYSCSGERFELHATDLKANYTEQAAVAGFLDLDRDSRRASVRELRRQKLGKLNGDRLKQLRAQHNRTDPFVHLSLTERESLIADSLDLVGTHDGLRLFGEIVDKQHCAAVFGDSDVVRASFTQLVSRFDQFLSTVNRIDPHSPKKGMLIMDNEPSHARRFEELLKSFRESGHPFGVVNHVIETPMFVDSRSAGCIQLADICSYSARRYVENRSSDDSMDGINFHRIFPQFARGGDRLHGVRHYFPKRSCACAICRERGHSAHTDGLATMPMRTTAIVGPGIDENVPPTN